MDTSTAFILNFHFKPNKKSQKVKDQLKNNKNSKTESSSTKKKHEKKYLH